MIAASRRAFSRPTLAVKGAIIAATPALAWAAQTHMPRASALESISLVSWVAIVIFAGIGWAVNDIDMVAELWNEGDGSKYQKMLARLKLLKTIIGSEAAGIFTYFLGKIAPAFIVSTMGLKFDGAPPEIHEFLLLIMVAGAGWQGARWFERVFKA